MAYSSARATLGSKDVKKVRKQTRPSATVPSTSARATLAGRGVRQEQRQKSLTSPFRQKARKLRRRYREENRGVPALKGEIEREIRENRAGQRAVDVLESVKEESKGPGETALQIGTLGSLNPESSPQDAAKFVAISAALGGAGKAIGAGAKLVKGTKAAKAATAAPKTAVKKTAAKAPKPVKSAAEKATRATKKARKSKAGKATKVATAPVRKPLKVASQNPGKTTLAGIGGPGAVESTRTGDSEKLTAPFEGTAKALNPLDGSLKRTAATTVRTLPGLVTAPLGMAKNVGLTGYRAGTSATGIKDYSGKEIFEPTKRSGEEIGKFAKHYAEVYGSGDAEKIKKATEEEFGAGMLIPAVGALRKTSKAPEKGLGRIKPVRNRRVKKQVSRDTARSSRQGQKHAEQAVKPIVKAARKVPGSPKLRKKDIEPADTIKVVAEEGIRTVEQAKKVRVQYGKRPEGIPKDRITVHDALDHVIANPSLLKQKRYREALDAYRTSAKEIEFSAKAKHFNQARTHGVALPKERFVNERAEAAKLGNKSAAKRMTREKEIDKQAEAEFLTEMQKVRQREGLEEPVYTRDADLERRGSLESGKPYPIRTAQKQHEKTGVLRERGTADQSFEQLIQGSVVAPRMRRAVHENTARFTEGNAKQIGGKRYLTSKEIRKANIDQDRFAVLDSQHFKQAVLDPESNVSDLVEYGKKALNNEILERDIRAQRGVQSDKGKKYVVIEKPALEEFVKQHEGLQGKLEKGAGKLQRGASTALLGYSPSWLIAQPIAESAQALAAVGPVNIYKGLRAYKKMDPDQKREFDASIGGTAGVGAINDTAIALRGDFNGARTKVGLALRRSAPGRVVHGLLSGKYAANVDRKKGLAIRRAVAAGNVAREYSSFTAGLKGLMRESDQIAATLKGKPLKDQMAYFAKNPKAQRKLEGYVDDVMGNWSALTHNERVASSVVIFYPFVRMSLEWTFHTFPKRHPARAATLQFLAQQNAEQVENLLGGKPSFFNQWASAPVYAGRGKELGEPTGLLPLQRIAPGSNALVEAVGEADSPRDLARVLNPVLGIPLAALGGYDPQTGKNLGEKYEEPTYGEAGRALLAGLGYLPAPVRTADIATGRKVSRKIKGKDETATTKIFDELAGSAKSQALRSLTPFTINKTSTERQKAEIGRLIKRAYAPEDDYGAAIERAEQAIKSGDGGAAEDEIVKVLDALVARKQLDRLYGDSEEAKSQVKDLAGAQMPSMVIPKDKWSEVLQAAIDAGIDWRDVVRKRKRRARSLMGNS